MILLTEIPRAHPPEFNEPHYVEKSHDFRVKAKEEPKHLGEFQITQTAIPLEGGRYCLHLLKPLTLKVNQNLQGEVTDWGINVDYLQVAHLPREVARRFLFLLSAAENEQLPSHPHKLINTSSMSARNTSLDRA